MPVMLDRNNRNLGGSDPETVATALAALRLLIRAAFLFGGATPRSRASRNR